MKRIIELKQYIEKLENELGEFKRNNNKDLSEKLKDIAKEVEEMESSLWDRE